MRKQMMMSASVSGRMLGFVIGRKLFIAAMLLVLSTLTFGVWGVFGAYQNGHLLLALEQHKQALAQLQLADQLQISQLQYQLQSEQQKMTVYARSLGQIQARMARLDDLGSKLVDVASLDKSEFDFDLDPAFGGARMQQLDAYISEAGIQGSIQALNGRVDQLGSKLTAAEYVMQSKRTKHDALPHVWPTRGGWVSSGFGPRIDPFTGKPSRHYGVDIANRAGAPILAASRGIVSFAGKMVDFGYVVDIEHGYGYKTRYAHMRSVAVKVGDVVQTSQMIGHIGSTGHSTGPHLHYEVRYHGKLINPQPFLHRRG